MNRFSYLARDTSGQTVSGSVEAENISEAAKLLRERRLTIVKLSKERMSLSKLLSKFQRKASFDDVVSFTRQFATMVNAGLAITDALSIMRSQASPGMQPVVGRVLADVEGGSSVSNALRKYKDVFSPVYIALVASGEEGGVLDEVLARLAENLEKERVFRASVRGALIYPVIVVIGMIIVAGIMTFFVIPKLTPIFTELGQELPLPTRVLVGTSRLFVSFWWLFAIATAFLVWAGIYFAKTRAGAKKLDQLKMNLPTFGQLHRKIVLAELSRTLGLMVGSGVSILEALRIVSGVVNNSIVAEAVSYAGTQIEKGFSLSYAFSQNPELFPPMFYQMISVGEESGKLDESLLKVSKVFEDEAEQTVKNITTVIGPAIVVFLALGVGFLAIAIFLPIYQLPAAVGS